MTDHAEHLAGDAEQELCDALDRLMDEYTAAGVCGACIARAMITHMFAQTFHDLGAAITREILEGNLGALEEALEDNPPRVN